MTKVRKITNADSLAEEFFRAGRGLADTPSEDLMEATRKIIAEALAKKTPADKIKQQFNLAVHETSVISLRKGERQKFRGEMKTLFESVFDEASSESAAA